MKHYIKTTVIISVIISVLLTGCSSSDTKPMEVTASVPVSSPENIVVPAPDLENTDDKAPEASPATEEDDAEDEDAPLYDEYYDDSSDGEIGTVELYDSEYPLILMDGLTYAIVDDHAEIIFTAIADYLLPEYSIPEGIPFEGRDYPVTIIGENVFTYCEEVKSLTLPSTVRTIAPYAFSTCSCLEEVILNEGLETIDEFAFEGCSGLKKLVIPESVKVLGEGAFLECSSLTQVTLPSSLTAIAPSLFSDCNSLEQIVLPAGVTVLGDEAFWYCEALESLELPDSLQMIGARAFYGCIGLKDLTLPANMVSVSDDAFDYCDQLTTLKVAPDELQKYQLQFEPCDLEIVSE